MHKGVTVIYFLDIVRRISMSCTDMNEQNFSTLKEIEEDNWKFVAENKDLIYKSKEYIEKSKDLEYFFEPKKCFKPRFSKIKILILTATDIERQILFTYFSEVGYQKIIKIPYEGLVYSFFKINDINVAHIESENTGSFSKRGSADTLKKAFKALKPSVVISVGIAFGLDYKEFNIGDVIIGRQFFAYDKSAKMKENGLTYKTVHLYESGEKMLYKAKSAIFSEQSTKGYYNNLFKAEIGNMLTGEFVVDAQGFRKDIANPFNLFGIIGGEMEAYGIFRVLERTSKVEAIVIKGICDWGVGKNAGKEKSNETTGDNKESGNANFGDVKSEFNNIIPKDAFQTIAMLNTCVILKKLLVEDAFYSDFKKRGLRKFIARHTN